MDDKRIGFKVIGYDKFIRWKLFTIPLGLFLILIAMAWFVGSARAEEDENVPAGDVKSASLKIILGEPAPVVVWNRTITVLRASIQNATPAARAHLAIARIEAMAPRGDWEIITIEAAVKEVKGFMIGTKSQVLFTLVPEDLDPGSDETLETAARAAADNLKTILDEHAEQLKWSNLFWSLGFSAAATLAYILVVWVVIRLKDKAMAKLDRMIAGSHRSFNISGFNLVPILLGIERVVIKLSILAAFVATTYIWLTFCFAQFFFTQPWADQLGAYLIGWLRKWALGIVEAVPGIFTVIVIFWITRVVVAAISRFFSGVEKGTVSVTWLQPDSARASRRIMVVFVWIFALTVAYPYIPGSGSAAFKGISVFAGLMISLGSSGFINHVMSGLAIAYSGAMQVGDYVSIGDMEGTVQELGLMSTKITTPKKQYVTIPNGVVANASVTNYTRLAGKDGAVMTTTVTIGYDAPWRQVHALLMLAANQTKGIRKSPAPFVLQRALSDFYVDYELRFSIDQPAGRMAILSELHAAIQDAFNEAGVQIMSPNFVSQPEKAVLVPKSQWHIPPASSPDKQDTSST